MCYFAQMSGGRHGKLTKTEDTVITRVSCLESLLLIVFISLVLCLRFMFAAVSDCYRVVVMVYNN